MTTPTAGLPISFSNDDAKSKICAKAQSSINALADLMRTIIKNSHSNDHLSSTLKQFAAMDSQLTSTQDRILKIEHTSQQLLVQSNNLDLDSHELVEIHRTFQSMKLDEH